MRKTISLLILSLLPIVVTSCGGGVKDLDDNTYKTVRIGNQEWMAENLNTSHYRNGDKIPEAKTDQEWLAYGEQETGAWCYYDNDPANGKKYGKLYNWYAVNDPGGLGPKGWHVPSNAEWITLTANIGDEEVGGKMKTTTGWKGDGNGTNESGFSTLPAGCRFFIGSYHDVGSVSVFWSSTESDSSLAWGGGRTWITVVQKSTETTTIS